MGHGANFVFNFFHIVRKKKWDLKGWDQTISPFQRVDIYIFNLNLHVQKKFYNLNQGEESIVQRLNTTIGPWLETISYNWEISSKFNPPFQIFMFKCSFHDTDSISIYGHHENLPLNMNYWSSKLQSSNICIFKFDFTCKKNYKAKHGKESFAWIQHLLAIANQINCTYFYLGKVKEKSRALPSFGISKQLEPLASSWHCKKICHVIWTWKNTSKIFPKLHHF